MSASAYGLSRDITHLRNKLNDLSKASEDIGTIKDGALLRSTIQSDIKEIVALSQSIKSQLLTLSETNNDEAQSYEPEFLNIQNEMQNLLPKIVQKLKASASDSQEQITVPSTSVALLDQAQVDEETEQLEILEAQVGEILSTMRELNNLFHATLDKLNEQRNIILSIDDSISNAKDDMNNGNEQLDKGKNHQKGSTKCLCWLFLFFFIVVAGVCLFLFFKFGPGIGKSTPSPTPTPQPVPTPIPNSTTI